MPAFRRANIRDYTEAALTFWRQRALFQSEEANKTRPVYDNRFGKVDLAAQAGRTRAMREEAVRVQSERDYQEILKQRAEAAIRDEYRR
jgi:hypothetical protein